jgi:uncharacterized protein (DUF697 family)
VAAPARSGVSGPLRALAPALPGLVRESRADEEPAPVLIGGDPALAVELRQALGEGGDGAFATTTDLGSPADEASVLVYAIDGEVTDDDEDALRRADRGRIPLVCVIRTDEQKPTRVLPYVPATGVVRTRALDEPARARVAERVVAAAPDAAWALARRLPVLREATTRMLLARVARQNALLGAARSVPGAGYPALTLNQLRLLVRLAGANGLEASPALLAGVVGAGFAFRSVARALVDALPLPAAVVHAGVAYGGTRAIGEAARALLSRRHA